MKDLYADEHWGARVSFSSGFLGVYAQQWDCWVMLGHMAILTLKGSILAPPPIGYAIWGSLTHLCLSSLI